MTASSRPSTRLPRPEPRISAAPGVSTPVDSTASDPCGILHYNAVGDNVDIQYVAYQPGNFLDWSLGVVRGTTGIVASLGGNTSAGSPGVPVDFNNTVGTLIGTCPQAAFGVNLYCAHRGTDGWGRRRLGQIALSQTMLVEGRRTGRDHVAQLDPVA